MPDPATMDAPATAARDGDIRSSAAPHDEHSVIASVVTINRSPQDIYDFWRDLGNLPLVMDAIDRIDVIDGTRSHWVVNGPAGHEAEWDAIITEDQPCKLLAWESIGDGIRNSGRVEFTDAADRGTVVRAVIAYDPPGGVIGKIAAKLFQREPAIQSRRDLRRLKQYLETGEVSISSSTRAHADAHKAG